VQDKLLKSNVCHDFLFAREDAAYSRKIVITHASYHGATKITRLHMYITFATRISDGTIPRQNSTFRSWGALLAPLACCASYNNVCRAHFVNCLPALCTLIKLDTRFVDKSNTSVGCRATFVTHSLSDTRTVNAANNVELARLTCTSNELSPW